MRDVRAFTFRNDAAALMQAELIGAGGTLQDVPKSDERIDQPLVIPEAGDTRGFVDFVRRARIDILDLLQASGGGHYGGSLSAVDLIAAIFLRAIEPRRRQKRRDRFILSKGHAAPAFYAVLMQLGWLARGSNVYGAAGSPLQGHPDMRALSDVDFSTGSLGQGLSAALGMALALRETDERVWCVIGDGECQEGQVWEAAMLAGRLGAHNLAVIVDANGRQEWGFRVHPAHAKDGAVVEPPVRGLAPAWAEFGWRTATCSAAEAASLCGAVDAISAAQSGSVQPHLLVAQTVKGSGVSFVEADPDRFHCAEMSREEFKRARAQLSE